MLTRESDREEANMGTTLGPMEMMVVGFPENRFDGSVLAELRDLTGRGVISVVNALLIRKDPDGSVTISGLDDLDLGTANVTDFPEDLQAAVAEQFSDASAAEIASELDPDSSVGVIIFENTWWKRLGTAIEGLGGVMMRDVRMDGGVVEDVVAALAR
jgi:hypothetical protein